MALTAVMKAPEGGMFRNGARRRSRKLFLERLLKIMRHTKAVNFVMAGWIKNDNVGMKQERE